MPEKLEQPNTFEEMEKKIPSNSEEAKPQEAPVATGEINISDFSDTAVGEQVKYNRPDLDGTEDVIDRFQVFMPNIETDELEKARTGDSEYWKVTMIMTYQSKNNDEVQNREYISGARCFKQRNGTASPPSIWYEGSGTQAALVWERVAEHLGKKPEELSPREFVAFLNSKPKVKIIGIEYKNFGLKISNAPKFVKKNMPGDFLA